MNDQHAHTKRTYSISDYDPNWITKFESIKDFISQVFAHKALQIEHVGSTSIQGMKAKPLIDVLVIVEDINDMFQETRTMIDAGYEWSENHIAPNTLLFYKTDTHGEKSENIHVCEAHSSKAHQLILMRDFLRTFPEKAKEYALNNDIWHRTDENILLLSNSAIERKISIPKQVCSCDFFKSYKICSHILAAEEKYPDISFNVQNKF
jgi:GrpB-like predicted nucleotidyltransferase (UPF0157 family)